MDEMNYCTEIQDGCVMPNFILPVRLNPDVEVKINSMSKELKYLIKCNGKFYRLSEEAKILVDVIETNSSLVDICTIYSDKIGVVFTIDEIIILINENLVRNGIVISESCETVKQKKSFLYAKFTLFSESLLNPITNVLKYFFYSNVLKISIFLILLSHLYLAFNFSLNNSFEIISSNPHRLLYTGLIFFISTIFHEFGHASACKYFGIKHSEIGFGLYLTFPVFYSNITNCWQLSRTKRAIVDISGIYFQFIFNVFLFVVYLFTKSQIIIYAILSICVHSIIVLNPFFRYDGYWLATDLLGIPNLRKRTYDFMDYFFKKYILKREDYVKFNINASKTAQVLFIIYSFISNMYFVYFTFIIINKLPSFYFTFIESLQYFKSNMHNSDALESITILLTSYKFIMNTMIFFLMIYFTYIMAKRIYVIFYKIYQTIYSGC